MNLPTPVLRWRLGRSPTAVLAFSGAVTLCLVTIIGAELLQGRLDARRAADTNALNVARAAGQDIARNLALYDLSLRAVARQLRAPVAQALDPALRQSLLFEGTTRDGNFGFVNVLNETGEVIADSASAKPRGGNFASRDYFRAQRGNSQDTLFIGEPFGKVDGAFSMIPLSRRLDHQDGSFAGVVVGTMRLAYFSELFARFSIGAHGTIALLRDDGLMLQRRPAAAGEIGRVLPDTAVIHAGPGVPIDAEDSADHRLRRIVVSRVEGFPLIVAVGLAYQDLSTPWGGVLAAVAVLGPLDAALLIMLHATLRQTAAAQANRARYLAMMGHEMRAPLQGLLLCAETIRQTGPLEPEQAHHLAGILEESDHLRDVVDRLFDYARIEAQGDAPALGRIDLRALIEQRRSAISRSADTKGLRLDCQLDGNVPRSVATDGTRLRIILHNLLGNAVKYTERGSVILHVSRDGAGLRFAVADTGIGVPPALRDRLATPHERLGRNDGASDGAGLGLFITDLLTRQLGGTLDYMPNPTGGSIFSVRLPVGPVEPPEPETRQAAQALPPLQLLVVDDSDTNREPAAALLRSAGHRVTEARSGEEAVQLAGARDFDGVLIDMCMPGIGGLEAARRVRGLPGRRGQVPILAVTGQDPSGEWDQWCAAGITAHVGKPCTRAELLGAVDDSMRVPACQAASVAPAGTTPQRATPDVRQPPGSAALADLIAQMGSAKVTRYLDRLSGDLHAMIGLLDEPVAGTDGGSAVALVHRIAGDAVQLGFGELAAACRQFEHASHAGTDPVAPRAALARAAGDALAALRQRLQESRKGGVRSASPV